MINYVVVFERERDFKNSSVIEKLGRNNFNVSVLEL